MLTADEHFASS